MAWKKGQSGNKKGRPRLNEIEKQNVEYFKEQLKKYSVDALDVLHKLLLESFNQDIKFKCAKYILDRTYGTNFVAEQNIETDKELKVVLISKNGKDVDTEEIEELISEEECIWNEEEQDDWGTDDIYKG